MCVLLSSGETRNYINIRKERSRLWDRSRTCSGTLMWTPSSSSMMRLACAPTSLPVSTGTPANGPACLMRAKISLQDLLMHMEKTFGNKHDYDAMIRTLYEVQQRDDETVEEYMLCIHKAIAVICCAYLECLPDRGRDLQKDHFYHRLCPYLHDALSFAMAELPEREQVRPTFNTLYTLLKSWKWGNLCICAGMLPAQRCMEKKHRHYPVPAG